MGLNRTLPGHEGCAKLGRQLADRTAALTKALRALTTALGDESFPELTRPQYRAVQLVYRAALAALEADDE